MSNQPSPRLRLGRRVRSKIKKWKLKGLVHSRRAKDQLTGLLAAFALTRYSRRLNQDVFVVQASCPALAGFPREDGPIKEA